MNKRILITGTLIVVLTLLVGPLGMAGARPAMDLEDDVETSILAGLAWLAAQQNGDGSWGGWCAMVPTTGLVLLKLQTRAYDLGFDDPQDVGYEYHQEVIDGYNYLMSQAVVHPEGFYFPECGFHEIYNTGIAMMALASSGQPLTLTVLPGTVSFMSWAQADPDCGVHRGGWRYSADICDSDNSNSGYATLGLGFAQAPAPFGFGLTIPQVVKDELTLWIDVIQDDVNGDLDDGGSWYDPYSPWVNILKTGNLLYEMGLVGDDASTGRVMDAVDYIERHWYDAGGCGTGWRDHRQAMFTMMKGLESLGIEELDLDGDNVPETVWFDEVAQHLIDTQNGDGSWPWDCWGNEVLSTAWALLTLEKTVPAFEIPVSFDIHPGSCPNPLNVDKKGVTPAAIAGTEEFDVTQVDPATLLLKYEEDDAGVPPLRWAYEDAAIPYDLAEEFDRYSCLEYYEGDGFMDLTLKFATQEISLMLDGVEDGDVLLLHLTGNLKEEFGGAPIVGKDVIWIIEK